MRITSPLGAAYFNATTRPASQPRSRYSYIIEKLEAFRPTIGQHKCAQEENSEGEETTRLRATTPYDASLPRYRGAKIDEVEAAKGAGSVSAWGRRPEADRPQSPAASPASSHSRGLFYLP
jgi:hypothetical protein